MSDDTRLSQLLDQLLDTHATPEEVCRSCPELLPEVHARWRELCRLRDDLDALFPATPGPDLTPTDTPPLPRVPGYEVDGVLGRGGMGVVFRARHVRLNRLVAVKMVLAGAYAGVPERERFRREAEAVAVLTHPNVVRVYDVGEADGRPYFTMELVEGGTLAQKLTGTPQPVRPSATLVASLARAVQEAHQSGIIHRDLKPANILLTPDGTPKVTDFGLARRLEDETGLTRTGTALGTPSYMAPEQARGKSGEVGPAADVYSLGAILYELLTGRPPFRGETDAATVQQVLVRDPVPPSRLNPAVPRDLETVCLKCLSKEPDQRYAAAAALANDLDRFLRGEAVAARPERALRRFVRRVLRRPALSIAVAVGFFLAVALLGTGVWIWSDRAANERAAQAESAAVERAADEDLQEMARHQESSNWPEANAAFQRAKSRLGDRGSSELRRRLDQGDRELELVARLESIRLNSHRFVGGVFDFTQAGPEYEIAFREAGVGRPDEESEAVSARINASPVRRALVVALDHWYAVTPQDENPDRRVWLNRVAALADPSGWRARAADPANWTDEAAFAGLVASVPVDSMSLRLLLEIEQQLTAKGKDPSPYMKRVQRAHPGDFWINLSLGDVLARRKDYAEATRYYQAALTARPRETLVHNNLGHALMGLGRLDEAVEWFRSAVAIDPANAVAHFNLALALSKAGRHDEALEQFPVALRFHPKSAALRSGYGYHLGVKGRLVEAVAELREAVAIDPDRFDAKKFDTYKGLRTHLLRLGRAEEACDAWRTALAANPPGHDHWYGYAELCLFLGRSDDYPRAREALLAKFSETTEAAIAERTARACLLAPASGDALRRAVALAVRTAERSKGSSGQPSSLFTRGLAEYRQGQFEQAVTTLQGEAAGGSGPAPRLVLALALHQSGRTDEARKTLAATVVAYDWRAGRVRNQDDWIAHIFRREAETLILPELPAFLSGTHHPRDNDERLALLGVCQFTNRTLATARLYADIFTADAKLVDQGTGHRYAAARAAVLAGCGRGEDAPAVGTVEGRRWREQARQWLRAELSAWRRAEEATPSVRDRARLALAQWRNDPDLAGVRESAELDKLPATERADWRSLWAEVGAANSGVKK